MSSWAVPGAKVVCIGDSRTTLNDQGLPPFRRGQVFTIRATRTFDPHGLFLSFEERDPRNWGHISGFRPLVSQSDDVAKFTHLLIPTNTPEHV